MNPIRCLAAASSLLTLQAGELLYNGIRLPDAWPPAHFAVTHEPPPAPPYLLDPPAVVPIDTGRQLFVDHFLIEETSLRRTFHQPVYFPGNPVLAPDTPFERPEGRRPTAFVFSGGVWYDPAERLYKIWYHCPTGTCYATSLNGVEWRKPELDFQPGANLVHRAPMDSSTIWLDLAEKDPSRRYKYAFTGGHMRPLYLHFSPDGIHWGQPVAQSRPVADRTTIFFNPFRRVWVYSIRDHTPGEIGPDRMRKPGDHLRYRRYWEHADVIQGLAWPSSGPVVWTWADRLDAARVDLNTRPELYNLDAAPYESLLVGLFSMWRGQPLNREKPNSVSLGFSRDGFHWDRPDRRPFLPVSEEPAAWNSGNVQSAGGGLLVVGDRLFFYVSGRRSGPQPQNSVGLATLRRDGFASMDAGSSPGALTTRPVRFSGKNLFVNVDSVAGELTAHLLDSHGKLLAESAPIRTDSTLHQVVWKAVPDLSSWAGRPVRFRFHLRHGRLYAFWVSPTPVGPSHGYVAAGGPGFTAPTDTAGSEIYRHCCATLTRH
jgi:hypothetical protein